MVEDAECALPFGPNRPEGVRTRNTAIIAPFSPRRNGRMEKSLFRKALLGHSFGSFPIQGFDGRVMQGSLRTFSERKILVRRYVP